MILASRRDPAQGYDNDTTERVLGYGSEGKQELGISSIVSLPLLPRNHDAVPAGEQGVWRAFGSLSTSRTTTRRREENRSSLESNNHIFVVFRKVISHHSGVDS